MYFWLVDVKSTVVVNGVDTAFDYINTFYDKKIAMRTAKALVANPDVLEVDVHKWRLFADGTQEHVDGNGTVYTFRNEKHREFVGD